jgi:ribosomal protein L15
VRGAARGSARAAEASARGARRGAPTSGSRGGAGAARKAAPPKARAPAKTAPKRPPAVASDRPRLTLSRAPPDGVAGAATGTPAEAERERAQQELANSIEAETVILRQRIVELTAMVERMQQEVQAQEVAQRVAEAVAKAPPPVVEPDWWEASASLLAAIVGLPILIAAGLLWKRRRDAMQESHRPPTRTPTRPAPAVPEARRPAPVLRNAPAGLAQAGPEVEAPAHKTRSKGDPAAASPGNALAVSQLSQATEKAQVYAELGHHDRAIEVLQEHIRQSPRSMPAAWLMLLDLYHATDRRQEFRTLAEGFHLHFNVRTPVWEGFAPDDPGSDGLAAFPHILKQVADLWRKPECRTYLERLLHDNREGRRTGFPLATYADILTLLQVLDAPEPIDIDLDLADGGKLDPPPRSPAASSPRSQSTAMPAAPARARKPMPPDSSASSRPVQRPITFELDPERAPRNSDGKPRS